VAAAAVVERDTGEPPVLSPAVRQVTVPLQRSDQSVDILVALREQGIAVDSVSVSKPSLDEVFLALTGHDTGEDTGEDTGGDTGGGDTPTTPTNPELEAAR
jgi:ABC-2 type transport system ATP-binding protein